MQDRQSPSDEVRALREAIAGVIRHNRRLRDAVRRGLDASPPLSHALNCERNGAHALIENVATAAKRLPRGFAAAQVPLTLLKESSLSLLESLDRLAADLPADLRRAMRHATAAASTVEERFHNFAVGASGADPDLPPDECAHRIDCFVRDLKRAFADINTALLDAEDSRAFPQSRTPPCKRRRSKGKAATKSDLHAAVKTILRGEDVNAAKPGPRLTAAKRRQIKAAEDYRATHCGCTLHNACLRSFVFEKGGYCSWKAMYVVLTRKSNN